jgi:hypothetical protein
MAAHVMMFDQTEPVRFALWNFTTGASRQPDRHQPAWDWQYVIRNPETARRYGYRARLAYLRFESPAAIQRYYLAWRARLDKVEER